MKSLQTVCLVLAFLCLNYIVAREEDKVIGDTLTIKCSVSDPEALGVYLYTRRERQLEVLYYFFQTHKLTVHEDYEGHVQVKNDNKILTIDIRNLRQTDNGSYWCACNARSTCKMDESGVFLLVKVPEAKMSSSKSSSKSSGMNDLLIPVTSLTAGSVLLLLLLVLGVWLVPKMKKMMKGRKEEEVRSSNSVYEVMTVNKRTEIC